MWLIVLSIQRLHKHNSNSSPNLLRRPRPDPHLPSPSVRVPPVNSLPQATEYLGVYSEYSLCDLGRGSDCFLYLPDRVSGHRRQYEYVSPLLVKVADCWFGRLRSACSGDYGFAGCCELGSVCEAVVSWAEVGVVVFQASLVNG